MPPQETLKHLQAGLAQSLVESLFFLLGPGAHKFLLGPPSVSVSPVLWKFSNQILLTFKVRFPGDSQSLCWVPRLESLLWA